MFAKKKNSYSPRKKNHHVFPILLTVIVGGGLIAAMLISSTSFDWRKQASENDVAILRNKFGIGGSCDSADLGVSWTYSWGHGAQYPNQPEVNCKQSKGISFFFTIGKTDNAEVYTDIGKWEGDLIGIEELVDYESYKNEAAVITYDIHYPNSVASYILIPAYINGYSYETIDNTGKTITIVIPPHKGAYYVVGNEPDWEKFVTPEVYARQYKLIHDRIKKYDPTAKISTGGLLETAPESCSRSIDAGLPCSNENRFAWLQAVRDSYRGQGFGSDLPVDFWNIHPYVYAYNFTAAEALDRVDRFKAYIDQTGVGDKPIWITEFGSLAKEGELLGKPYCANNWITDAQGERTGTNYCVSLAERMQEHQMVAEFMRDTIAGLMDREFVERWFWYYGGESWTWTGSNFVGDIYKYSETGEYNAVGKMYQQLIADPGSIQRPQPTPQPTPESTPPATPIPSSNPPPIEATPQPTQTDSVSSVRPIGWFDAVSCTQAHGWTCDMDYPQGSVEVHFYKAVSGVPAQFIGKTTGSINSQNPADFAAIGAACGGNGARRFSYTFSEKMPIGTEVHAIPIDLTTAGTPSGGGNNAGIQNSAKVIADSPDCH